MRFRSSTHDRLSFSPPSWLLAGFFVAAASAANAAVAFFGASALPFTAALLVPFDLLTRDVLHRRWSSSEEGPVVRMALLILSGCAFSFWTAGRDIALASTSAFLLAALTNTFVFSALWGAPRFKQMVSSSVCAAFVDSVVFQLLAFGELDVSLALAQVFTKSCSVVFMTFVYIKGSG